MGFLKLNFQPGVNKDQTDYTNEGGWRDCDKVRWHKGFPQKIGGWVRRASGSVDGFCRQMWNWVTSYGDNLLAITTNRKVNIEINSVLYNITPLRDTNPTLTTTDTDNSINTNNTSTTVVVTIDAHGALTGDYVEISGVTGDPGGIPVAEINTNHEVEQINVNAFSFTTTTAATSTATGAGGTAIQMDFEVSPGNGINETGFGWGTDGWGVGGWGEGSTTGIALPQRDWFLDNFNNDLIMNIRNGQGYIWERGAIANPGTSLGTRAIRLSDYATNEGFNSIYVPVKIGQLLVSQRDKHVIAFGAVVYGSTDEADFDPLLIRWANQNQPSQWEQLVTNSAGDIRVSRGSRIVRALPTRQEILVFTDSALYALQFLGTTDVFGLQEYATNISIASPRSCTYANDTAYWMGKDKFYTYTGRVQTLECTLRDHVFEDINFDQGESIICGTNEEWGEIWWFYPSNGSNYNDRYVVHNYQENAWYHGELERTAWLDTAQREFPHGAASGSGDGSVVVYEHENGVDDDGSPLAAHVESSTFDLDDGYHFMITKRLIPDITFRNSTANNPSATIQLKHKDWPGESVSDDAQDEGLVTETTADNYTKELFLRARARQMALRLSSTDLGVTWRLGSPRLDLRQSGRR